MVVRFRYNEFCPCCWLLHRIIFSVCCSAPFCVDAPSSFWWHRGLLCPWHFVLHISSTGFPLFGIGVSRAQKCNRKALEKLECADCLNDVFQYTEQHKADLCSKKFIPSQPGFAKVPDSVAKQLAKRVELQQSVLDSTMEEIRCAKRKLGNRLCDVHRSLRTDGTFDAIRSPIQPINAQLAKESVGST
ncbi:hypothetical protein ERJ75_000800000 [Trypanosoma vivax]|nr:hypothetical protein ERJ75_000800000 [Trypanosoma vivax]